MCLIVFGYRVHKEFPLIVAANRDEFYSRPTEPIHCWPGSSIIAGKDKEKGGTWMGATKSGRFAAITNVRASRQQTAKYSRGEIVKGFLETNSPHCYLEECNSRNEDFDGYNLICGNSQKLYYATNQDKQVKKQLQPGVYGLSNASLNTPWPKVRKARNQFTEIIESQANFLSPKLFFDLLSDTKEAKEQDLPDTGVNKNLERKLSPMFIIMENYGTRSQTVLFFKNDGKAIMEEKTYDKKGERINQKSLKWKLEISE
ncbi:NRDE family protein [Alteribacillus sp. JSM 102045]|uniref:NRDE family protein n=1 Tax=Alteribacillus sp. JSM 102045 TaxID=1562101 RepID=UPI0035C12B9A